MHLISARVGLTNYYQNQVIRNNQVDMSNQIVDQLVTANCSGGISRASLLQCAAASGCLNAQATDFATIAGGWNDSKGLMQLDFVTEDNQVRTETLHVIGYIYNNSAEGLTDSAIFVPQFSWKSTETATGSLDLLNPITVTRKLGGRTDYMCNDGSTTAGMVSLRPRDVIEYGMNQATQEEIMNRLAEEGQEGFAPINKIVAADIQRVGVVASKRGNLNSSSWAADILDAGTQYQQRMKQYDGGGYGAQEQMGLGNGMYGELATQVHQASNREPELLRDEFFREMMNMSGGTGFRGFRGFSIADLMMAFPNFEEIHDVTLYNADIYPPFDYTQTAMGMGTSNFQEIISQQLMFNIADLMMYWGISRMELNGSNCDFNDGPNHNSNIVIIPSQVTSLENDDFNAAQKAINLCQDLSNQIFVRLQGDGVTSMTPVRFRIIAELFGSTVINMTIVDENNISSGFDMSDVGGQGMKEWSYPTFAINNASSILGNDAVALEAGSNFFSNVQSYFS